jgi:hypothetical protein
VDISTLFPAGAATPAFAALTLSATAVSATVNFGATSFAQSVPSGFSAGPVQIGYANAVDGDAITDGTAAFRAGCRFKQTLTLSSPQPAQAGYLYAYPKLGRASTTYFLDPKLEVS